jgi:hypothetical protein
METEWDYGKYRIVFVYNRITPDLQAKIIDFWRTNNALPAGEAPERRVRQVVLVAFDERGEVAGLNTVYPGRLDPGGSLYFFYRQFIQAPDRVFGMMRFMTMKSWKALRDLDMPDKPQGIVIITENPKLMRRGMVALFESRGWELIGRTPQQQDVWRKDF